MAAEPQPTVHSSAFDVLDAVNKQLWKERSRSLKISGTKSLWLTAEPIQDLNTRQIQVTDSSGHFADLFLRAGRHDRKVHLLYSPKAEQTQVKSTVTLRDVRVGSEMLPLLNAVRIMLNFAYPAAWKEVHAAAEPGAASVYEQLQSGTVLNTTINIPEGKLLLRVAHWAGSADKVKPLLVHVMLLPAVAKNYVYYTSLLLIPHDSTSFRIGSSILDGKVVCTPKEHRAIDQPYIYGSGVSYGVSVSVRTPPESIEHVRTTQELLQRLAPITVALIREAADKRKRGIA